MSEKRKLYMVQAALETASLYRIAKQQHIPQHAVDAGYLAHCLLARLFGLEAVGPFSLTPEGRIHRLLMYTAKPLASLRQMAEMNAEPADFRAFDWEKADDKPMPDEWPEGHRLAFETRICPVRRKARGASGEKAGVEQDAYLIEVERANDPDASIRREPIYRDWLKSRFETGGAGLRKAEMSGFKLVRLVRNRHTKDSRYRTFDRPAAVFRGELEILDAPAFSDMLARGVGRHTGFGFGMLLLRPAR